MQNHAPVLLELLGGNIHEQLSRQLLFERERRLRDQIGRDFTKPGGISITHNTDDMEKHLRKRPYRILYHGRYFTGRYSSTDIFKKQ